MLSDNLGDMLATMELVKNIDGVAERDQAIVEARQERENEFLSQVLDLAQVQESSPEKRTPTKYSDSSIVIDVDDEEYADTLMRLAQINGVSAGEIVPEKHAGGVKLHVMPHVFASEQMEDVREMVGLGLESKDESDRYDLFVNSLVERQKNPNHSAKTGKFASLKSIRKSGSRSFQFSAPLDKRNKKDFGVNDPKNTYNVPHYAASNGAFKTRKNKPCGRAARPYWIKKLGLPSLPANKLWRRCHDYGVGTWAALRGGSGAAAAAAADQEKKARAKQTASRRRNRSSQTEANSTAGQVAKMLLALRTREQAAKA